ncbi:hypothetical protein COE23_15715 [Bacillus cereus]|nr:hypothetical protein COE23_15715 [Bacillus cereus]
MRYPRVLVVSNNCFSDSNSNGRTLGNFFINWDKDSIAQFYIQAELPNSNVCENFYRVTDYEVLNSFLKFQKCGRKLEKEEITVGSNNTRTDEGLEKKIHSFPSKTKKKPHMYILRNLLWYTKKWKIKQLYDWIDAFQPEIILFQAGDSAFMCDIARMLSIKYDIPLMIYNSEDYYLKDRKSYSLLFHIHRRMLKRSFKKMMNQSKYVVYITDVLKEDFDNKFKTPSEAIFTASSLKPSNSKKNNKVPVISYLGNVGVERWRSIVEIGRALQKINKDYFIDVYTQKLTLEAEELFTEENGIKFRGAINYGNVVSVMQNSDLLVHAESFSDFIKVDLRHAFSTKVADSLACGTCLFAYGPEEIASIKYLKENDVACVVTEEVELEEKLREIIANKELREYYVEKALKQAQKRHNSKTNSERFENIIRDVVNKVW